MSDVETIQRPSTTYLNLATREGALTVEFIPPLDEQQYRELIGIVDDFDSEGVARVLILDAAKRWGRQVTF